MSLERVTVIGLGLLGGSLARAAVERGLAEEVVGVSRRPETAREALDAGWVHVAGTDVEAGVRGASLVARSRRVGFHHQLPGGRTALFAGDLREFRQQCLHFRGRDEAGPCRSHHARAGLCR